MDACTVTASDVITAFAISSPGLLLAGLAGFFGLERPANRFAWPITQLTSEQPQFPELSFQPSAETWALVMLWPPAPAREPATRMHVPPQLSM